MLRDAGRQCGILGAGGEAGTLERTVHRTGRPVGGSLEESMSTSKPGKLPAGTETEEMTKWLTIPHMQEIKGEKGRYLGSHGTVVVQWAVGQQAKR